MKSLVVRKEERGDIDLSIVLLTEEWGKVWCIVKGGRKSLRRFTNMLEPPSLINASIYEARTGNLILEEADLIDPYEEIKTDLGKLKMAFEILNFLDLILYEPEVFEDILKILDEVRVGVAISSDIILFQLRLLKLAGYLPESIICSRCSKEITGSAFFLSTNFFCETCGDDGLELSKGAIVTLKAVGVNKLKLSRGIAEEMGKFISAIIGK